jgi:rhodanese-related sulfurtransferase
MGNQVSLVPKVSYEDIQMVIYRNTHIPHSTLIINTLPPSLQHCLIKTTVDIRYEEQLVNTMIHKNRDIMIIVYGKNSNDITILHKYEQLVKLGFTNVHIYTGGIFEWMLLYEIYGKDLFKITRYEIDILRYRPKSVLLGAAAGGGSIGGYIEDGDGMRPSSEEPEFRVNIPVNSNDTNESGMLMSGIKWLFR